MTQKSSKQKQSQYVQEQLITLQKQQMDPLKDQNESNKQFFPKAITRQQENEREERERDRESFVKLGKGKLCFLVTLETK